MMIDTGEVVHVKDFLIIPWTIPFDMVYSKEILPVRQCVMLKIGIRVGVWLRGLP